MYLVLLSALQNFLSIVASLMQIFPGFRGKAYLVMPEKEVDAAKEMKVLHSEPSRRWNGLAFFKKYRYGAAEKAAESLAAQIKGDSNHTPDLIVGIGRGGAIFGSMLSYRLENTPILIVDRTYFWDSSTNIRVNGLLFDFDFPEWLKGDVLVVAGEYHSGMTMEKYCAYLRDKGVKRIKTCAFFVERGLPHAPKEVDFHAEEDKGCPLMPWQDRETIRDSISAVDAEKLKRRISSRHKRIFIVRHGETAQNKDDVFIGKTDVQLNSTGQWQADQAGIIIRENLIQQATTLILYSPLERCCDTAYRIMGSLPKNEAQMKRFDSLKERNYGKWEGMSRSDIRCQYDELYRQYEEDPMNCIIPDADPMSDIVSRAEMVCSAVKGCYDQNIVLVTHKATGRVVIAKLLNKPVEHFRDIEFRNGDVVILDSCGGEIKEFVPKH